MPITSQDAPNGMARNSGQPGGRARYSEACSVLLPGAFASPPSSSPRFLARNADTLARFMHRSEQYRLVLLVLVSTKTPWQPAAWQTPYRSIPRSVTRTASPITAPAAYLSATEPLSV